MRRADLYLLDEPMGQLEPQLRSVLRGRIKSLLNQNRMTAIFVTHDQTEANALADRIAVMEGGVLQQFASQAELKERPANLFVATFIGEPPMNVFEAAVSTDGGPARLVIQGGPVLDFDGAGLAPAVRQAIGDRAKVLVGVRPHKVRLGAGPFQAKLVSNQWLGDQTHVAAEVAGKLLVSVVTDRVSARLGSVANFGFAAADLHVFDPRDGPRPQPRDGRPHDPRHPHRHRRRHLRHQVHRLHPQGRADRRLRPAQPLRCRGRDRLRTGHGPHLERHGGDVAGPRDRRTRPCPAHGRPSPSRARATAPG